MKKNFLKKLISIALCAMLAVSGSVYASAVSIADKDITVASDTASQEVTIEDCYKYYSCTQLGRPQQLDEDTVNNVKDDYISFLGCSRDELSRDDVTVEYYGSLDEDSLLIKPYSKKHSYVCVITYVPLGNYIYVFTGGQEVFVYKNNKFYSISELYNNGELTNNDIGYMCNQLNLEQFKSKSDIRTMFMMLPVGDNKVYTPETAQRYSDAFAYAHQIYNSENPTTAECTKAYFDLELAFLGLVEVEIDRADLENCYHYARTLNEKFGDVMTQEDSEFMYDIEFEAQMTLLYPDSEEYFYSSSAEIRQKLLEYKLTTQNPDIYSFEYFLKIKELAQTKLDEKQDEYTDAIVGMPVFKNFDGYFLISARDSIEMPVEVSKRYGNYILESCNEYMPSIFGYLAVNPGTGDIITLEEGLESGIIDDDKLFDSSVNIKMYMLGDADNDRELTIKDATEVQKAGLDLVETVKTGIGCDTVFDYNGDGRVSILDVTCIQKKLAGIYNV
ncbi:MAG: hypothetical protein ACI4XI_02575 [Ruminococcus sp.]